MVRGTTLWVAVAVVAGLVRGQGTPQDAASAPPPPGALPATQAPETRIDEATMDVIENFRAPVEKHENGLVKTMLRARRAAMRPNGVVEAENVVVEMYDAMGVLEGVMTAESATVDQRRGKGVGRGAVRFEREDVSIKGVGLTWSSKENLIRIESEAEVELERDGKTLAEGWR